MGGYIESPIPFARSMIWSYCPAATSLTSFWARLTSWSVSSPSVRAKSTSIFPTSWRSSVTSEKSSMVCLMVAASKGVRMSRCLLVTPSLAKLMMARIAALKASLIWLMIFPNNLTRNVYERL